MSTKKAARWNLQRASAAYERPVSMMPKKLIMLCQGFFGTPGFVLSPRFLFDKERGVVGHQGLPPCPTQVEEMSHAVSGKVTANEPRPSTFLLPNKTLGAEVSGGTS